MEYGPPYPPVDVELQTMTAVVAPVFSRQSLGGLIVANEELIFDELVHLTSDGNGTPVVQLNVPGLVELLPPIFG